MNKEKFEVQIRAATIDTGVLIEYLSLNKDNPEESRIIKLLEDSVLQTEKYRVLYIPALVKTELLYITCRSLGWEKGKSTIEELLSNFIVIRVPKLDEIAARIKCKIPIAIADCYTLAIGNFLSIPTYFMQEKEFDENVQQIIYKEFSIDLKLIEKIKK